MLSLLMSAALLPPAAETPAPVAMVLASKGSVTLERNQKKPRRLGSMELLRPGDRLRAGPDGEAKLVFLDDGRRERLKPTAEATVGAKGCTPAEAVLAEEKEEPIVDSKFSAATRAEAAELAPLKKLATSGDAAEMVLAAATYEAHGVYEEALGLYEKLAEKEPKEANFQVALASYYERAGRLVKAKAARENAKKLGVTVPEKP